MGLHSTHLGGSGSDATDLRVLRLLELELVLLHVLLQACRKCLVLLRASRDIWLLDIRLEHLHCDLCAIRLGGNFDASENLRKVVGDILHDLLLCLLGGLQHIVGKYRIDAGCCELKQLVYIHDAVAVELNERHHVLEFTASSINPIFADYVLQPAEEAQQKVMKNVTDDLAKIFAGIEVPAQPNGAQIAMQLVQAYVQQPDVAQRAQQDEAFAARLQKYAAAYEFQLQQAQNAEIGRIGTAPAQMGGVTTQGMQQ